MMRFFFSRFCQTLLYGIFLLTGCGNGFHHVPNEMRAYEIVWHQTYHATREAPEVDFRASDCSVKTTYNDPQFGVLNTVQTGIYSPSGACVGGYYYVDYLFSYIAIEWRSGYEFNYSAYPHELLHAYLRQTTGDGDPNHTRAEWKAGGILEQARAALKHEGL